MSFVGVELEARATGTLDHQLLDDVLKRNVIGQIRPPDVFSLSVNADEAARAPRFSDGSVDFGQNLRRQSSHCEPQHGPITWRDQDRIGSRAVNLSTYSISGGRKSCWLASRTCDETSGAVGLRLQRSDDTGRRERSGAFLAKRHVSPDVLGR